MLDLFGWQIGMDLAGAVLLVFGAIVIAAVAQYIGRVSFGYEWVFTGVAALGGGWLGSEAFGTLSTWGPAMGGLYIVPALIGALVVGAIVDAAVRFSSGGTYLAPRPI
jgi:uncharacterized membrane protein YeaQ/YmgE (transglycosylase-associated protein family)